MFSLPVKQNLLLYYFLKKTHTKKPLILYPHGNLILSPTVTRVPMSLCIQVENPSMHTHTHTHVSSSVNQGVRRLLSSARVYSMLTSQANKHCIGHQSSSFRLDHVTN